MNAQSLMSHKDEIEHLVQENNVDILCLTETWISPHMSNYFVNIPNLKIFRRDHGRGGGVCIFIRDDLKVTEVTNPIEKIDGVEDVWVTVQCRKLPSFIVGCIYRHPKASVATFDYILESFRNMSMRNKPLFILGDFNDNLLNIENHMGKIVRNVKLNQVIDTPTRITSTSATLIDLLITNRTEMIHAFDVIPSPVADHEMITINLDIKKPKCTPIIRFFRTLANYSQNTLCNLLLDKTCTLNTILDTDNVSIQASIVTNVLRSSLDTCAPLVTRQLTRPPAPWLTDDIRSVMKERDELQKNLKLNRYRNSLQNQYKTKKIQVRNSIANGKKQLSRSRLNDNKGNISGTWNVVKQMLPDSRSNSCQIDDEDLSKRAEDLNNFFANVGRVTYQKTQEGLNENTANIDIQGGSQNTVIDVKNDFKPTPVDCETVILTVKELSDSSSYGSDEIPVRFIRDSLPVLAFYITLIINTSIVTNTFPDIWKTTHVIPIHKGGNNADINNYRPISLICVLSKILEKVVAKQLASFLESNKLLVNSQHGFRSKLSTETALLKVTDTLFHNIDNKQISLLILLDLSKAFDSVHHDTLLRKCVEVSIDPTWIDNYLSNRLQAVRLGKVTSNLQSINFGVPQGSILGPILFSIYVNDLSKSLPNTLVFQYADDTQIIMTGNIEGLDELIRKAENILLRVKTYFQINGLLLNEKKTQCMFVGSRQYISRIPEDTIINFNGSVIKPVKVVKNLGVYMDQYLSFDSHIDHIHKKVTGILMYLTRIKDCLDYETRVMVIDALVLSIINYCSNVWGSANKTQIERVQKLQNFAARVAVGGIGKYDHVSPAIKRLNWLKIENKCSFDICMFIFKILKKRFPEWLYRNIFDISITRDRPSRQRQNLYVHRVNTEIGTRMIPVRGPKTWNKLPIAIRDITSINVFKDRLRKYFLDNQM